MNEQNILIVRCGEVALKGMNKPYFERMLVDRIRNNLKGFRGIDVRRSEGIYENAHFRARHSDL